MPSHKRMKALDILVKILTPSRIFFCPKWKQVVSIVMSWCMEITEIFNKPPELERVTRCFQFPQDNFYSWVFILEMRKVCYYSNNTNKTQAQQVVSLKLRGKG